MKHPHSIHPVERFFLVLLAVVITSALFLYFPTSDHAGKRQGYSYFHLKKPDDSLEADELPPDVYTLQTPEIHISDYSDSVEVERLNFPDGLQIQNHRKGYSGLGYLTNFPENTDSAIEVPINLPSNQHYAITLCMASDAPVTNALRINGNRFTMFSLEGAEHFIRITFYGIFLPEGENTIAIDSIDGGFSFDYLEICNDTSVYHANFEIDPEPCNPNASPETVKLYHILRENWGNHIFTGQYVSDASNRELTLLYQITGQQPAIRFNTLGTTDDYKQLEAATDWSVYMHGIVGMMWLWDAPFSHSVYAKDSDFNLYQVMQGVDPESIALLPAEDAVAAADRGSLSPELLALLQDIDKIADILSKLQNMDIPVLWRPLHEAGGGWYWWGAYGRVSYEKLWTLLYHRLTDYHQLNNLIWIWNGQSAGYLVPEDTYDIAAVDVYLQPDMEYGSRYEQFLALARITNSRKMLALSECSALPSPEMMTLDHAVWSFFGLWYGDYLLTPDGKFNDLYYSSNDLYNLYNSKLSLTLNDFLSICQ